MGCMTLSAKQMSKEVFLNYCGKYTQVQITQSVEYFDI